MLKQLGKRGIVLFLLFVFLFILACGISIEPGTSSPPAFDSTKAALELQATSMALQLTQSALNSQPPAQPTPAPPEPTVAPQPANPQPEEPAQVQETPTQDVEARIKSANVLVYENTDEYGIGMWVQDALDGMGIKYTQTGSYSGHFMEYLNSGTKYDLIIVDAEAKDRISGEFWDVVNTRLTRDQPVRSARYWVDAASIFERIILSPNQSIGGTPRIQFLTNLTQCFRSCTITAIGPTKLETRSALAVQAMQ
jgi:hypothetical protein